MLKVWKFIQTETAGKERNHRHKILCNTWSQKNPRSKKLTPTINIESTKMYSIYSKFDKISLHRKQYLMYLLYLILRQWSPYISYEIGWQYRVQAHTLILMPFSDLTNHKHYCLVIIFVTNSGPARRILTDQAVFSMPFFVGRRIDSFINQCLSQNIDEEVSC